MNKHEGNKAFGIRGTSAPGAAEEAPASLHKPSKSKNDITEVHLNGGVDPTAHPAASPPSLFFFFLITVLKYLSR